MNNFARFLFSFNPEIRQLIRTIERIEYKLLNQPFIADLGIIPYNKFRFCVNFGIVKKIKLSKLMGKLKRISENLVYE